jgi:hypothetical protein
VDDSNLKKLENAETFSVCVTVEFANVPSLLIMHEICSVGEFNPWRCREAGFCRFDSNLVEALEEKELVEVCGAFD